MLAATASIDCVVPSPTERLTRSPARIRCTLVDHGWAPISEHHSSTSADNVVSIDCVAPARVRVELTGIDPRTGRITRTARIVAVAPGERARVDLVPTPESITVHGVVRCESAAVAHAIVEFEDQHGGRRSALTDRLGRYSIDVDAPILDGAVLAVIPPLTPHGVPIESCTPVVRVDVPGAVVDDVHLDVEMQAGAVSGRLEMGAAGTTVRAARILLLPVAPLLRYLWDVMDPTFFVVSSWN